MSVEPPADSASSTDSNARPELLRVLGLGIAIAMVVGNTIGSGIFRKPGTIAADAGAFPLIIAGWIGGGLVCLAGALCFAELGAMLPRAGGMFVYLKEAYGRPVAFVFGWCEFFFGTPASCGALSIMIVETFSRMASPIDPATGLPFPPNEFILVGGSILLLAFVATINVRGALWGGSVQAVTTIIKAGSVALIALLPFLLFFIGRSEVEWSHFASTVDPKQTTLPAQMAAVLLAVMWAYNGWEGVTPVAAEVRDPSRNIPRALLGGVGILMALYVGANLAYHGVLSMTEMVNAQGGTAQAMLTKQIGIFSPQAANFAVTLISGVIVISAFGAINSNLMHSPRVAYAMGRDGVFFEQLGHVHARFRTPAIAICTQASMAAFMVVGAKVAKLYITSLAKVDLFDILTDYVIFSASVFQVLTVIGVFLLRRKHPEWERPYRVLGYPVTPLLFIGFYLWFLPTAYRLQSFSAHVALVLIAAGIPAYFIYAKWKPRTTEEKMGA